MEVSDPDRRFSIASGPCRILMRNGKPTCETITNPPFVPIPDVPVRKVDRPNRGANKAREAARDTRREAKLARYAKLRAALEDGMPITAAGILSGVSGGTARYLRVIWGLKTPCAGCGRKRHSGRCGGGK